jgi:CRISPR system Cascade subunit CasA
MAPSAVVAQRAQVRLDVASIIPVLARLAPDTAPPDAAAPWDRLLLFAAMLKNNPDIGAARAAIASAQAAARASRVRPGPTLTLSGEYAGRSPDSSPWLYGAGLDLPIDSGGRRASRLALADLAVVAARYDYAEVVWQVRMALRQALADRLLGEARLVVAEAILAVRQRQFDAMARRVAAGAASRADLERVRADTADALHRRADALAQRAAGNAGLAAALGVPVAEVTPQQFLWDGLAAPAAQPEVNPAQRDGAIAARADVLRAATAYDQSEANLRGEIARQYPAFSVGAGYSWDHGLVRLPFNLGLSMPPLDGNRAAITAATARRQEAATRLEATVAGSQVAIDGALVASRQARAALARVRQSELPAARRLAAQADNELRAGSIDRSEWSAAQAGALLAQLSELDAVAAVLTADGQLEAALRRPLEGPELAIRNALGAVL